MGPLVRSPPATLATMDRWAVSNDFVDADRTDLEQQIYQTASSRLDAVLHLDTCVLVPTVPYHRSLLDWFQFPSLHPTPSSTTLHDDPHDPRQPFTLESCPRRHSEALLTKSDCISRAASPLEGDHQSPTLHERSSRSLLTPLQRQPAC